MTISKLELYDSMAGLLKKRIRGLEDCAMRDLLVSQLAVMTIVLEIAHQTGIDLDEQVGEPDLYERVN